MKVKPAPSGAAAFCAASASGWRQTNVPSAASVITPQMNVESHAAGTWMYMILTVSPCW
jgi:hypothetical protein